MPRARPAPLQDPAWSIVIGSFLALGCGNDGAASGESGTTSASSGGAATEVSTANGDGPASATTASTTAPTTTSDPGEDTTNATTLDGDTGTPGESPDDYCGRVLFAEPFEDTDWESREWYDGPSGTLSTDEHIEGSTASFACRFVPGATNCEGGTPGRRLIEGQTAVCLSYWVKYSANWEGSGQPYHPHEFHFATNLDDIYVGPAYSHLTTYIEQVGGVPRLAIQDSVNVDLDCILLNNDDFVGCNGDFDSYAFTEERSAAACNGLLGDLDGRDCFPTGNGYYSARFWDADIQAFGDSPPWDKNEWHHVVSHWRLNDVEDGIGLPNGVLRYWVDGELLIEHDAILMRTGAHPDMLLDQFIVAPYIGDGSPVDQTMWVDELEIHAGI